MRRLVGLLAAALGASLVVAIAVMLAAITLQVVSRYIFAAALSWSEELAILMFSWATLSGLALGVREGFHVALTLGPDRLAPGSRRAWGRFLDGAVAALGAFLAWAGWRFVDLTSGSVSAAMAYPTEILTAMAPACGVLVAIFAAERALHPPAGPSAGPVAEQPA